MFYKEQALTPRLKMSVQLHSTAATTGPASLVLGTEHLPSWVLSAAAQPNCLSGQGLTLKQALLKLL